MPAIRRELVDYPKTAYPITLRRACRVVCIRDSVHWYQHNGAQDDTVIADLQRAVEKYPAYGLSTLFKILRR